MIFCWVFDCATVQQPQICVRRILWRNTDREEKTLLISLPPSQITHMIITQYSGQYSMGLTQKQSTCVWRRVMLNHQMISRARKTAHYSQILSIINQHFYREAKYDFSLLALTSFLFYAQFYTVHILQWLNPALVITNKRLISHSSKVCVSHYREQICVYIAYLWFSFRMIV